MLLERHQFVECIGIVAVLDCSDSLATPDEGHAHHCSLTSIACVALMRITRTEEVGGPQLGWVAAFIIPSTLSPPLPLFSRDDLCEPYSEI